MMNLVDLYLLGKKYSNAYFDIFNYIKKYKTKLDQIDLKNFLILLEMVILISIVVHLSPIYSELQISCYAKTRMSFCIYC